MNTQQNHSSAGISRLERVLAFAALGLAAASVISFFAIIIGTATGMNQAAFGSGIWPFVAAIPLFGLPAAFVMVIALLIINFVRKGRKGDRS